ncbi:LytS/YhcK type 5TM receptor domain-containing protein [Roseovarius sp. Pro17]|uniref:LytS/YhcK type 5TM receptor domain-containing protein n=1 Tax=Roseovarius sp. Pro17 TaxID=3108175 RepID=UPI002D7998FC|nr:LytS/YhcK type 5TM receptor domain-containing protein [Roseovarius sp. Pro17]
MLLPQIIGSLAVVAVLASVYGVIRTRMSDSKAQIVLGLAFGLIAMFQMNALIEIVPGVILDMRNVPVALAGAFLGWRGALLCLAIAAATRFSIGGVGMPSGIAAMTIACLAGHVWDRCTLRATRRNIWQFLALAVLVSGHIGAAVLLPWDVCLAFFATAALPMTALNMLSIPIAAVFLERERLRMMAERALIAGQTHDPVSGLVSFAQFTAEATALLRSDCNGRVAGFIIVRALGSTRLAKELGRDVFRQAQGAMRLRMQELDVSGLPIAVTADDRLVMALDFRQVAESERIATEVRRILNDHAYHVAGDTALRMTVSIGIHRTPTLDQLTAHLEDVAFSSAGLTKVARKRRARPFRDLGGHNRTTAIERPEQERLFTAASVLLACKQAG